MSPMKGHTAEEKIGMPVANSGELQERRRENRERKSLSDGYRLSLTMMWEREGALRDLLNASTETTILLDTDGTIVALNETAARRIGRPVDELVGKRMDSILPSTAATARRERINRVIAAGKPIRFEEINDGRIIDNNLSPIFDAEGRVRRLSLFGVDITQQRQGERLLKERQAELKKRSRELEELNAALKVLLREREKDKDIIEEKMLLNMKDLVIPYLEQLKSTNLSAEQRTYVSIIEQHLGDVVSPFSRKLASSFIHLTPKEIQVASLVKDGKTNKEIAEICHVSVKTVEFYRSNIRNKLGLKHKKTNLRAYLDSMR